MTTRTLTLAEAYLALGLPYGASKSQVKQAFRVLVKQLHPDVVTPTPQTLRRLAEALAAYRTLDAQEGDQSAPCPETNAAATPMIDAGSIEVSAEDAARGVIRTADAAGKRVIVRIPRGAVEGQVLHPEGEPHLILRVQIRDAREEPAPKPAQPDFTQDTIDLDRADRALDQFVDRFAKPSAAGRLAKWVRGRSAA